MKSFIKGYFVILLILILLVSFTGCSNNKTDDITSEMTETTEATETTETTETTEVTETVETTAISTVESSTEVTLSVIGIYQGQIDNNSIEVKIDENYMVFRSTKFETLLVGIETGDNVEIKYLSNSEGQNELIEITKK